MSQKNILLGVNIDHVATLRPVRGTRYPYPVHVALQIGQAGANSITLYLREDRRHIQDSDLYELKSRMSTRMNLEMAVTELDPVCELNIADAVFMGLEQSVKIYKQAMYEVRA